MRSSSWALALALIIPPWACHAAVPGWWEGSTYAYLGGTAPLGEVLAKFAMSMGVKLKLDPELAGVKTMEAGRPGTPSAFLDRLAAQHRLQWFVFNGNLYVEGLDKAGVETIPVGVSSAAVAKEALVGLGLFEPKYGWGELDGDEPAVLVSGPPAYRQLVKQVVGHREPSKEQAQPEVMVFPLKYASATDNDSPARDRSVPRPGVASALRSMFGAGEKSPFQDTLNQLSADASKTQASSDGKSRTAALAPRPQGTSPSPRNARLPLIEPYPPTNAVLVLDLPERRKQYEALIARLDVPAQQVEVIATIVDIESGKLSEWSPDLTLGGSVRSLRLTPSGSAVATPSTSDAASTGATVLWSLHALALRLRALESEGAAKVLARPSVLTLDNMAAVLDLSQSAYFRLTGERSVDLKGVSAGTLLRVTPHVLSDTGTPHAIRLAVDVEDGNLDNAGNGNSTPLVSRNSISTQALLQPGQALVIGGYRREQNSTQASKVPVLGALPVVGRLFRTDSQQAKQTERMFILHARVIPEGGSRGGDAPDAEPIAPPAPAP
jgi:type III secretion protein C